VKALALSAIDAARGAGARYADVRLTNTLVRSVHGWQNHGPQQTTDLGLSVRALVNGYWGWAATPLLSADEAVRVARLAVKLATMTATRGKPNAVELGTIPVTHDGEWMTPVKIDPFELDLLEMHEWLYGLGNEISNLGAARGAPRSHAWMGPKGQWDPFFGVTMQKQERVLASTEGTFLTQTVLTTKPSFRIRYRSNLGLEIPNFNMPVQAGWERIAETPIIDLFLKEMEKVDAAPPAPPQKPLEVGRYDIVFSAATMAQLLGVTLGPATEADRALGYEANATGGSYLGPDPLKRLGTLVASPLVNITAERSNPLGLATAKWDDEGVMPEDFPLVANGRLMNYQTTRAQAAWLAPWYEKHEKPVRSLGCAMAPDALFEPMQHLPNLVLHPGTGTATEESMVQELEHGLYIVANLNPTIDWMCANGYSFTPGVIEIRRGKPVATFGMAALMFNTDQLWKNIQVLGDASSAVYLGGNVGGTWMSKKGDPLQQTQLSIGAVPARVKQLAVVNPWQRA
jgi:TldD protein